MQNQLRLLTSSARRVRSGHVLALFAVLLPAIFGLLALAIDASLLIAGHRHAQNVADAAATAAARDLRLGRSPTAARSTAVSLVCQDNQLADAEVTVQIPPGTGPHQGDANYAEVLVRRELNTFFAPILGAGRTRIVEVRAVAGAEPATAGAAIHVLDPSPSPITAEVLSIPPFTVPPVSLAGLEVLGLGAVRVDAAVLVNTEWGGVDEQGAPTGTTSGFPYGVSCTPILPLTRMRAVDLRVVGGVDNPSNYGSITQGSPSPLKAGRLPTPDPFIHLPAPTTSSDPDNVSSQYYGGVTVTGLPLIGPTRHLYPGVYDYVEVLSGVAVFHPGVYVIRGQNPLTRHSLALVAGKVTAQGVMFYLTDSEDYDASSGQVDASDGEVEPPLPQATELAVSATINAALLGSVFTPLDDPSSPFDGILIYQRRHDRRPIVIVGNVLIPNGTFSGTIYAKWGQIMFGGQGTFDVRLVAGSVRFINVFDCTIQPTRLLPPAREVYLVE